MPYHHLDPTAIEPTADHPCDRRSIADAAGLSVLAAATYRLRPGEELAVEYHYHEQREELLYVLAGTLRVETPDGEYAVGADEVLVVEPESPIRPYNPADADGPARVLGVGAPQYDPGLPYEPEP